MPLCREYMLRLAGGAAEFLLMRSNYLASLASVSICGYIAGSGDRHASNLLLNLQSGALVPIDFGYGSTCLRSCQCWCTGLRAFGNVRSGCHMSGSCQCLRCSFFLQRGLRALVTSEEICLCQGTLFCLDMDPPLACQ